LEISALTERPSCATTFHTALLTCEIKKIAFYSKTAKMNAAPVYQRVLLGIIDTITYQIALEIIALTETPSCGSTFKTALLTCEIKKIAYCRHAKMNTAPATNECS
jgi:hypothetical protein